MFLVRAESVCRDREAPGVIGRLPRDVARMIIGMGYDDGDVGFVAMDLAGCHDVASARQNEKLDDAGHPFAIFIPPGSFDIATGNPNFQFHAYGNVATGPSSQDVQMAVTLCPVMTSDTIIRTQGTNADAFGIFATTGKGLITLRDASIYDAGHLGQIPTPGANYAFNFNTYDAGNSDVKSVCGWYTPRFWNALTAGDGAWWLNRLKMVFPFALAPMGNA